MGIMSKNNELNKIAVIYPNENYVASQNVLWFQWKKGPWIKVPPVTAQDTAVGHSVPPQLLTKQR